MKSPLDFRPIIVAVAGPNGAGKTTFCSAHLAASGLPCISTDRIAQVLCMDPYAAAEVAASIRRQLVEQRESFIFETVLSDPAGEKLAFLRDAAKSGYTVIVCFIGLSSPEISQERVAMRVSQGGHDVPAAKVEARFERTLRNLEAAIAELPHVWIFDNSDLAEPMRKVVVMDSGRIAFEAEILPQWLRRLLQRCKTGMSDTDG